MSIITTDYISSALCLALLHSEWSANEHRQVMHSMTWLHHPYVTIASATQAKCDYTAFCIPEGKITHNTQILQKVEGHWLHHLNCARECHQLLQARHCLLNRPPRFLQLL